MQEQVKTRLQLLTIQVDPSNQDADTVHTLDQVKCPTCFLSFPIATIVDHADSCCDVWVDDVSEDEEVGDANDMDGEGACSQDSLMDSVLSPVKDCTPILHTFLQDKFIGCAW